MAGTYRKTATSKSASVDSLDIRVTPEDAKAWMACSAGSSTLIDKVPRGWYTAEALSVRMHCSPSTIHRLVRRLRAKGKAVSRKFTIDSGSRVYPVIHYKLK